MSKLLSIDNQEYPLSPEAVKDAELLAKRFKGITIRPNSPITSAEQLDLPLANNDTQMNLF